MALEASSHGLGLDHHDHVCGFYYTAEERDAMLLPYLREGLASGNKCVAVVDSTRPAEVVAQLPGAQEAIEPGRSTQT